jgi:hypothetical protein
VGWSIISTTVLTIKKMTIMKTFAYAFALLFAVLKEGSAQNTGAENQVGGTQRQFTIEPSVGIHTNFGTDLLISTLVQRNVNQRFCVATHSSYNINNITQRHFNHIKTEYNFSLHQKFGLGYTRYAKKSSHTFFVMAGARYTAFKETLHHPDLNEASLSVSAFSPDYGVMYSLKKGVKDCFITFRAYVPLYPWPLKGSDIFYVDGNRDNIALEVGVGFKIK